MGPGRKSKTKEKPKRKEEKVKSKSSGLFPDHFFFDDFFPFFFDVFLDVLRAAFLAAMLSVTPFCSLTLAERLKASVLNRAREARVGGASSDASEDDGGSSECVPRRASCAGRARTTDARFPPVARLAPRSVASTAPRFACVVRVGAQDHRRHGDDLEGRRPRAVGASRWVDAARAAWRRIIAAGRALERGPALLRHPTVRCVPIPPHPLASGSLSSPLLGSARFARSTGGTATRPPAALAGAAPLPLPLRVEPKALTGLGHPASAAPGRNAKGHGRSAALARCGLAMPLPLRVELPVIWGYQSLLLG